MRIFPGILAAVLFFGEAGVAAADSITSIEVRGLQPEMEANVRHRLSLASLLGRELGEQRLDYLLLETERETRQALEPFGYFSPGIHVTPPPEGNGPLLIEVSPGEPVRVRNSQIAVQGAGAEDPALAAAVAGFAPARGAVFDQVQYEASKARINRGLADRGYFDADFATHTVEVTRAEGAADIALGWNSGRRYGMGPVEYQQLPKSILDDAVLAKIITWEPGTPFVQERLDQLRESLGRLDYFSGIDIAPAPEQAKDGVVPVKIVLTPAKRSIYTAGLSYGSTNGAGLRLGVERRYLNRRGHKALAQIDWAQQRKVATAQYRVPAFAWVEGWYALGLSYVDEQTDYIDNQSADLSLSRSGEISDKWRVVAAVHALRERWAYTAEDDGDPATPPDYKFATVLYPELSGDYVNVDQRLAPRRGWGGNALLRAGVAGAGSNASFLQAHASVRWFKGLGSDSRLLVRGELGRTFSGEVSLLPPTLRFHAGGDRSIRGYGWREVGPRVGLPGHEFPIGASNVLTASIEYERFFNGPWGAAVFVDTGSAFDSRPDLHTGVGVGLRWRSPVGPLRVDLARGLDHPDSPFQITLNFGADL
ncbi:MAG: autotransporter assembly complex family protein [Arenimonas sp.]